MPLYKYIAELAGNPNLVRKATVQRVVLVCHEQPAALGCVCVCVCVCRES
jgi:hypothetical protein